MKKNGFKIGKENPKWKCGKFLDRNGYVMLSVGEQVREHRYIMEKHIGRKLRSDEIIHHKDENKKNNSIQNLTIMNRSDHTRLHKKDKSKYDSLKGLIINKYKFGHTVIEIQNQTGIDFSTVTRLLKKWGIKTRGFRKIENSDAMRIRQLYSTGEYTQRSIADMFGLKQATVSDIILNKYHINYSPTQRRT